ncbi:unnamed protein product [Pleuronectes platessa]|uniref:Uncharacterized protein n=1 Tax=Pleuronectes platessa TaxID=8262 RepID=A0A9N7THG4_PLEPL|nr:unnamed protein product [Pleuronectes platessa]
MRLRERCRAENTDMVPTQIDRDEERVDCSVAADTSPARHSMADTAMAFTFAAFCYMLTLVLCASLIFFVIWQIIAFDELRTDFKNPIDQSNPTRARERILNIERICNLLRRLVVPEYSIHGLFCLMFMCAGEWVTLGLNIPLLFYHLWRFFHRPADGSEVMYDPVSVMNADILNYCQKESWCKLGFYLLSFFYYLYRNDERLSSNAVGKTAARRSGSRDIHAAS